MNEIKYVPINRRALIKLSLLAIVIWVVLLIADGKPQALSVVFAGFGLIFVDGLSYRGNICICEDGIYASVPKTNIRVLIPWSRIKACKFYEGAYDSPSVCILFQNPNYTFSGQRIIELNRGIQLSREGRHILCDVYLRRLSFGRISPEEFADCEVFGIIATAEEYDTIRQWWGNSNNKADYSNCN